MEEKAVEGKGYSEYFYKARRIRDRKSREDIFLLIVWTFSQ